MSRLLREVKVGRLTGVEAPSLFLSYHNFGIEKLRIFAEFKQVSRC